MQPVQQALEVFPVRISQTVRMSVPGGAEWDVTVTGMDEQFITFRDRVNGIEADYAIQTVRNQIARGRWKVVA